MGSKGSKPHEDPPKHSKSSNPRVASAQAMATAVVKRPISQQQTPQLTPPLPPTQGNGNDLSHLPPAAPSDVGIIPASTESGSEFSHYNSKLTIENFDLLKVLGKGSFGKVMLVKKKGDDSGMLYALKTLRKAALTQDKLYMALDYMGGGELFFWLKKDRKFTESRVRLYTAEITLALEALHNTDIVYRDLKPENILLDAAGHLRLTDFGLAKSGITGSGAEGGTKTFCGTPEYLAPEILENKGHGKGVDWWALGTLVFEMLTGLPPYYDTNVQRMYHKILHEPLRFPKGERLQLSENAKDLLRGMLERKVTDRLGCGPTGAMEMKRSLFLSTLDMSKVMRKGYDPEFRPPASTSPTDVRNFDTQFTNEQAADSLVVSRMTETMQQKSNFEGFTYENDNRLK